MINKTVFALMMIVSCLVGIFTPFIWFLSGMRHATGPTTYWPPILRKILRK